MNKVVVWALVLAMMLAGGQAHAQAYKDGLHEGGGKAITKTGS